MNDIDREDTKPIKVLSELNDEPKTRVQKNSDVNEDVQVSRSEKFKDVDAEIEEVSEEEKAEEALAEKNINEAEAILEEEKNNTKEMAEIFTDKKEEENKKKSLIDKFKELPKGKKIGIIAGIVALLIALIVLVVLLVTGNKKTEEKPETVKEEAPVIVDNFYFKDGYLHFLDSSEKEIGSYECANKDSDLCYVAFNNYRDNFNTTMTADTDGKEVEQRLPIYNDDYVFVSDNANQNSDNIVMYSINKANDVDTYTKVKAYDGNYIVVADMSGKYGLLKIEDDGTITTLIKPSFNYIGMIDGKEQFVAQSSKGYIIIDEKGKELSSALPSNYEIKDYSKDLIVAYAAGEYNVYNYYGDLLANGFTYASVIDGYMGLVDSNNKIFIRDKDNNKMNEEGISLKNKEYVKTFVYDSDNKLKETKQSYYLEAKSENLSIAIYPVDYKDPNFTNLDYNIINTNKNYKMMNYFDGKLYFYKDESKTDIAGSYTCNNKNSIGNNNELTSCYVAKESVYEDNESFTSTRKEGTTIPMIYNKYVFINDGSGNVVLYDLVNNKTLGTYESVSSYIEADEFGNVDKDIVFTALNKKGKYGMVSLTQSGATAKIKFNYNKLEKFANNYILAQNSENKWQLLYGSEESTSVSYDGKIQTITSDKSYFKVGSGNSFYVYDTKGAKVINTSFKYVNMYPAFFIGVDSSDDLFIYDYTGKKVTTEAIKVSGTSCSVGQFATATVSGSTYTINYCKDGSSYTTKTIDTSKKEEKEQPVQPDSEKKDEKTENA